MGKEKKRVYIVCVHSAFSQISLCTYFLSPCPLDSIYPTACTQVEREESDREKEREREKREKRLLVSINLAKLKVCQVCLTLFSCLTGWYKDQYQWEEEKMNKITTYGSDGWQKKGKSASQPINGPNVNDDG